MKTVVCCFLSMLAAEIGMMIGFALGGSLEEILVGMLALFADCLLYIRMAGGRGSGT